MSQTAPAHQDNPTDPGEGLVAREPASRRARRPPRQVTRYTLDLDRDQHAFLRLWSLGAGTEASRVMRSLLYLLEADPALQQRVRAELFADTAAGADGGTAR